MHRLQYDHGVGVLLYPCCIYMHSSLLGCCLFCLGCNTERSESFGCSFGTLFFLTGNDYMENEN